MFQSLSDRLSGVLDKLTRRGSLTDSDVAEAMREVRRALLEAVGQAISELSLTHTLDTAAERVGALLGTDRVTVYLVEDRRLVARTPGALKGPHEAVAERLIPTSVPGPGRLVGAARRGASPTPRPRLRRQHAEDRADVQRVAATTLDLRLRGPSPTATTAGRSGPPAPAGGRRASRAGPAW